MNKIGPTDSPAKYAGQAADTSLRSPTGTMQCRQRLDFDTAKDYRLLNHQPLRAGAIGFDKLNPSARNVP
jgi:hypothetical protein